MDRISGTNSSEQAIEGVDLADALSAFRESKKLKINDFRTTGLFFNHQMTKAYVNVILGPGAFQCEGWGLMFHRINGRWTLIWEHYEWVS